ncbi:MAG: hypothetical protein IIZ78_23900 [Clostridiales bacterium]|nr:hypothetical protein [Clostridiales bacterium]
MIKCYKDPESKDKGSVIVELEGDCIEITSDFVCIASKMLNSGIPMEILTRSLLIADEHKKEWRVE